MGSEGKRVKKISISWLRSRKNSLQAVRSWAKSWVSSDLERLAVMVANAATGLGMEVYGYDPYLSY